MAQGFNLAPVGSRAIATSASATRVVDVAMLGGGKKAAPKKAAKKVAKKVVKKAAKKVVKKAPKKTGLSYAQLQRQSKGSPTNEIGGLIGEFITAFGALGKK